MWYKLFVSIVVNIYNLRRAILVLKASLLRISVSWNVALFSDVSKVVLLSFSRVEWIKKEFIPCIDLVAVRNKRSMRKLKAPYRFSLCIKKCVYHCFNRVGAVRHSFVNLFRRLVKKDFKVLLLTGGTRGGDLVEALRYKPEGRGSDS